ncbi:unnamed protein product [Phytophthora fragariaefolia]|uniref:Unnamed protein product n=1 Tax=Phytophthora fragariaefolia TaxID=1490495 RepID=A0A9W6X790_9STRA|nr:unnamed protein product [Phytophthora fragariaefolia]
MEEASQLQPSAGRRRSDPSPFPSSPVDSGHRLSGDEHNGFMPQELYLDKVNVFNTAVIEETETVEPRDTGRCEPDVIGRLPLAVPGRRAMPSAVSFEIDLGDRSSILGVIGV